MFGPHDLSESEVVALARAILLQAMEDLEAGTKTRQALPKIRRRIMREAEDAEKFFQNGRLGVVVRLAGGNAWAESEIKRRVLSARKVVE